MSAKRARGSKKFVANKAAVTILIRRIALPHKPSAYVIATQMKSLGGVTPERGPVTPGKHRKRAENNR